VLCWAVLWALGLATPGAAQSSSDEASTQLWGNVILDFPKGHHWLFETDFEPKTLVSGGEKWWSLDFTPLVEYYPAHWIDLVGESFGYTHQDDDVNTTEVTPRVGFRLNLLNDLRERAHLRQGPFRRVRVATLVRFEYRNLWYSDASDPQHEWRLRIRLEGKIGINHADFAEDKSLYGMFDAEGFIPLSDGVDERFASKVRTRAGLGYRLSYKMRFEVLYVRDWHRDAPGSPKQPTSDTLDARLKLFF
jgi:Protein of unknown function (DUF2490)